MKNVKYFILLLALVLLILASYCWFFEIGVFNKHLTQEVSSVMVSYRFVAKPSSFLPYLAAQNKQYFDALQPTLFYQSSNFVRFLMLTFGQFFLSAELYFNESENTRVLDDSLIIIPLTAAFLEIVIGFARDFVHYYVLMCFQDLYTELISFLTAFEGYVWCCNLMCLPEGKLYSSFLYDIMPVFKEIKVLIFKKEIVLQDVIDLGTHLDVAKLKLTAFETYFKQLYPNKQLPTSFYQMNFKVDMLREAYLEKFSYMTNK